MAVELARVNTERPAKRLQDTRGHRLDSTARLTTEGPGRCYFSNSCSWSLICESVEDSRLSLDDAVPAQMAGTA
jgi:hypothetical protein